MAESRTPDQVMGPGNRSQATQGPLLTVDPLAHVASVANADGGRPSDVPILQGVGPDGDGDFSTPTPGWTAELSDRLGMDAIDNFIPMGSQASDEIDTWLALTGSNQIYRLVEGRGGNYRSNRPSDLLAGDRGQRSKEGAAFFALRGGVAGVKVSDLCQLILNQVDDMARLLGRNMEILTDWGSIRMLNQYGSTKLIVRGAGSASKTYKGKYDFELSVGGLDTPNDPFFQFRLINKAGRGEKGGGAEVFSLIMDQSGNQSAFLRGDQTTFIGGHQGVAVTGDFKLLVGRDADYEVDGSQRTKIEKSHELQAKDSTENLEAKHINAKKVTLGSAQGQKAPMGEDLLGWAKQLVSFLNDKMIVMTPTGPSANGARYVGILAPEPPDFLSDTLSYPKKVG